MGVFSAGFGRSALALGVCLCAAAAMMLPAGCSKALGFKDPTLAPGDDDSIIDGAIDAPIIDGAIDTMPIDTPMVTAMWMFVTNAQFQGSFGGAGGGARAIADAKCDDLYQAAFTNRMCSHVHAVLQVDNNLDTLQRMAATFMIPSGVPIFRATDATKLANQWADAINPSLALLAPVSTSGTSVLFWSGKGISSDTQCTTWTSQDHAAFGSAGDATTQLGWLAQADVRCDQLVPHLMCVCW